MAIEYVNGAVNFDAASYSTIAAPATNHTAGNLIVVIGASYSGDETNIASITDTAGNAYTRITGAADASSDCIEIWYAKNIIGNANNIVTINFKYAYSFRGIHVLQYSGCDTGAPLDTSAIGSGQSAVPVTANITTTQADEVLVAGDVLFDPKTHTAGTGYTIRTIFGGSDPSFGSSEDRIVSSTGTYNASYTLDSSISWAMVMATFKAAEAPAGNWFLLQARNELQGIRGING